MLQTSQSSPHRKAHKAISGFHAILWKKKVEKLQIFRIVVVRKEEGSVGVPFTDFHAHQNIFRHAVGAPLAVGTGLLRRHAQDGETVEHWVAQVVPRETIGQLLPDNLFIGQGGTVWLRFFSVGLFQPIQVRFRSP